MSSVGRLVERLREPAWQRPGLHHLNFGLLGVALAALVLLAPPSTSSRTPGSGVPSADTATEVPEPEPETGQVAQAGFPLPPLTPAATAETAFRSTIARVGNSANRAIFPPSLTATGAGFAVPILMYHYIRINPDPSDTVGVGLSIAPAEFDRQMRYLADNDYRVIGLDELVHAIRSNTATPERSIVLTFDDGYFDFYESAYPVLYRYRMKATSFVITDLVGVRRYLTWEAIREMSAGGLVTFGAHTTDHSDLTRLPPAVADRQIGQSKRVLEDRIGKRVTLFNYPSGQHNAAVMRLVEEAGYLAAVSTRGGSVNTRGDIYRLKRVRVDGRETLAGFVARLRLADPGKDDAPGVAQFTSSPSVSPTPTARSRGSIATQTPRATSTGTPEPAPMRAAPPTPLGPDATVPDVVGLPEREARRQLGSSGLEAGYTNYQSLEDVAAGSRSHFLSFPVGRVVSQQPAPGVVLKRGEKVNLAVREK